jgi:hypothetical protein
MVEGGGMETGWVRPSGFHGNMMERISGWWFQTFFIFP